MTPSPAPQTAFHRPHTPLRVYAQVVGCVLLLLAVSTPWTHFDFQADDWWWDGRRILEPGFGWTDTPTFARLPLSTLIASAATKSGLWTLDHRIGISLFFALHALAFALFFQTLLEQVASRLKPAASGTRTAFVFAATLLAFYPSNYQIQLWPYMSMHAIAELLIALSFRTRRLGLAIFSSYLGLCVYDAFPLLLFSFMAISLTLDPAGIRSALRAKGLRYLLWLGCAGSAWVGTKILLGKLAGSLVVIGPKLDGMTLLKNFNSGLKTMGLLHFYRANWILSLTHAIAVVSLGWLLIRERVFTRRQVALGAITPFLCSLPLCTLPYEAQRAYFGPLIAQALVIALGVWAMLQSDTIRAQRRGAVRGILALLFVSYAGQWAVMFAIKERNHHILLENEAELHSLITWQCPKTSGDLCEVEVPPPNRRIRGDWVLPEMFWKDYHQRFARIHFPDQRLSFRVRERLSKSFEEP